MLTGFTAALLLITASELGDKTFFISMCLAMRHSRRFVLLGSIAALAAMTVLSVLLGQIAAIFPKDLVHHGSILLFIVFGFKCFFDASRMPVECRDKSLAAGENLVECMSDAEREAAEAIAQAEINLRKKTPFAIALEAFILVFIAEWGDRTQFSTITLAAADNPWGVALGATLGHAICALIAVLGGRMIAGRISERTVTLLGGILFFVFAIVSWFEGV